MAGGSMAMLKPFPGQNLRKYLESSRVSVDPLDCKDYTTIVAVVGGHGWVSHD
jgi:hypothetical protein